MCIRDRLSVNTVLYRKYWLVSGHWCNLDYFLEDIVQMLDFTPPPSEKKRKGGRDDDETVDTEDKDDKEVQQQFK